jgi:heat-inducible transcriptional repressor
MGKIIAEKKNSRKDREREVLLGLVELYIKEGKPIGSHTLQDEGFEHLSSATIRNYFSKLEMEGYLKQHHISGGRSPTDKAFRIYAEEVLGSDYLSKEDDLFLSSLLLNETKTIPTYLQKAVDAISELTACPTFLIAPRFDQDFIIRLQLLKLDSSKILCAVLTDFGQVHTEIIQTSENLSDDAIKKIEEYFQYRLTGSKKPNITEKEEAFAKHHYNEIVLRHFVSYTNLQSEEIYRSGFSKLLLYPEFHDPSILASTLALIENSDQIKPLLNDAFKFNYTKFWIGDDLKNYTPEPYLSSLIATPYKIGEKTVGVIASLGPDRLNYKKNFSILSKAAEYISANLTKSLYKYKLTYRQPKSKSYDIAKAQSEILGLTHESQNE